MQYSTLFIGGCRSGKSRHAVQMADAWPTRHKWFLATCVPQDNEMRERIRYHQQERGPSWQTLQEPIELANTITKCAQANDIVVVDCLTLWVSNLLLDSNEDTDIYNRIDQLCRLLSAPPCPNVLVSNEVGTGIVPENALARRYRDLVGRTNQQVAAACSQDIWMVAGIPVTIKNGADGLLKK
jgi:adenosylcobinamide kinase/adenosylcobinamide-phosphate guanylyltransferase